MKKHFSILTCLELILKGFSNPALLMSCPQEPFGSRKSDFFDFFKPFVPGVVPAGAFWRLEISLSEFFKPRNCVFPIQIPLFHEKALFHFKQSRAYFEGFFESCAPDVVPAGAFWELELKMSILRCVFDIDPHRLP